MSELICIRCPLGCRLSAKEEAGMLKISGNRCKKGEAYAKEELIAPKRMVTCTVRVAGAKEPLSVKTASPVPKQAVFACVDEIKALALAAPIHIGDVVLSDVCGTGVAVVATRSVGC